MKRILITGGTVFVSKYTAQYYLNKGYEVFVLNRNTRSQLPGARLIHADRSHLGNALKGLHFDVVFDINSYNKDDIHLLLDALESYGDYIFISSSAVYPDTAPQPFSENSPVGPNSFWKSYGTNKIEAEQALTKHNPKAYILRPPYLYGPMNNVYREAFVFDCALKGRTFYLPSNGEMKLQFFYIDDLCLFMDVLLEQRPSQRIFNVGNRTPVSIADWVKLCYQIAQRPLHTICVSETVDRRNYFSFHPYEYFLDVSAQKELFNYETPMKKGLEASFDRYLKFPEEVTTKPFMEFIDFYLK